MRFFREHKEHGVKKTLLSCMISLCCAYSWCPRYIDCQVPTKLWYTNDTWQGWFGLCPVLVPCISDNRKWTKESKSRPMHSGRVI